MVETKLVVMVRRAIVTLMCMMSAVLSAFGQCDMRDSISIFSYDEILAVLSVFDQCDWRAVPMDGSRTGCKAPAKDNVPECVGTFRCGRYISPSGRQFRARSSAAKVAKIVTEAQPKMARVKEVIGYSPKAMTVEYPEGALSNWFIDNVMEKVSALAGMPVDVGVGNFGGIRVDMPEGDILLDDMLSMFPFRNQVVYLTMKGMHIRAMLERMAEGQFQVLGGVRVVAKDGRIVSAEIGGEPLDDERVYSVATISFLLHGGDGLRLADNALEVRKFDVDIIDVMLEKVYAETAAGRPIVYEADRRVVIL